MREMIMLDKTGHSEFSWSKETDHVMVGFIQKKMEEGIRFFILEPRLIFPDKMKKIDSVIDIGANRKVVVSDSDMQKIIESGHPVATKLGVNPELKSVGIATTPQQVIDNRTIAIKPARGG